MLTRGREIEGEEEDRDSSAKLSRRRSKGEKLNEEGRKCREN